MDDLDTVQSGGAGDQHLAGHSTLLPSIVEGTHDVSTTNCSRTNGHAALREQLNLKTKRACDLQAALADAAATMAELIPLLEVAQQRSANTANFPVFSEHAFSEHNREHTANRVHRPLIYIYIYIYTHINLYRITVALNIT